MTPNQKMVAFKPLVEDPSFYSISDGSVLMIRPSVVKVLQVLMPDGKPLIDGNNNNVYTISVQNVVAVLTREEYRQLKKSDDR